MTDIQFHHHIITNIFCHNDYIKFLAMFSLNPEKCLDVCSESLIDLISAMPYKDRLVIEDPTGVSIVTIREFITNEDPKQILKQKMIAILQEYSINDLYGFLVNFFNTLCEIYITCPYTVSYIEH